METAEWVESVNVAARNDDQVSLARLFDQAVEVWGRAEASRRWLGALSGFDASAITG